MQWTGPEIVDVALRFRITVVVVNRQIVNILARNRQNGAVPLEVVVSCGDDFDRRIHRLHLLDVAIQIVRIRTCVAVPANPVSPNLVSNLPVLHVERLSVSILCAHGPIS